MNRSEFTPVPSRAPKGASFLLPGLEFLYSEALRVEAVEFAGIIKRAIMSICARIDGNPDPHQKDRLLDEMVINPDVYRMHVIFATLAKMDNPSTLTTIASMLEEYATEAPMSEALN